MKTRSGQTVLHPTQEHAFQSGLASMFRQWTVLELAVHNQWGGPGSGVKAEDLQIEILDLFRSPERIYKDDISLVLEDFLESQLNVICEDGSPDEIGEIVCTMWRECCADDFTTVERTLNQERMRVGVSGKCIGMESGDAVLSDDEVETEDVSARNLDALAEGDEEGEEEMEVEPVIREPVIDEDGFEVIIRKSKRGNKPK
jgi:pre-rRNA-processing protein TSR2